MSGLARGIDTRAHRAALDAGGRTFAVIGTGPDKCYPRRTAGSRPEIASSGAVVTEYPPGTGPGRGISRDGTGSSAEKLSLGTIVVESDDDGGAMITASMALDQDREVFRGSRGRSTRGSS